MTYITIATPPVKTVEEFDAFIKANVTPAPEGLEARYAGQSSNGSLRVIGVWTSKEHADRFVTERLGPALVKTFGPEYAPSEVEGVEVAHTLEGALT